MISYKISQIYKNHTLSYTEKLQPEIKIPILFTATIYKNHPKSRYTELPSKAI